MARFSRLNCNLICVYGNHDRNEEGLEEVAKKNSFEIYEPPKILKKGGRKIAVFHEPDNIDAFLMANLDIDIVLHGHTHRYREEKRNETLIFNPGESAGMRKGNNVIGFIDLDCFLTERIFF